MTPFHSLRRPIVAAPMAGGVSTPRLVRAAADAGGIGFLASGYALPSKVEAEARESGSLFGINIFLPTEERVDWDAIARYRALLEHEAGAVLPDPPEFDDDGWESKLDLVIGLRVPVVSFTFACPPNSALNKLHKAGVCVVATVTNVTEGLAASEAGVDVLCLQGAGAGGHRGGVGMETDLPEAVARLIDAVKLPVIAAGGLATPDQVRAVLAAGAIAAQVGTALLRTPESGARPAHKAALVDPRFSETVVTRAFTGRAARAMRNGFVDRFDRDAPSGYPYVHHLTKSLRDSAAARGDVDGMSLWAGRQHALAQDRPAAEVIATLAAELP